MGEGGWKERWWEDPEGYKVELVTSVKSGRKVLWSNYSRNPITRECNQRSKKCLRGSLLLLICTFRIKLLFQRRVHAGTPLTAAITRRAATFSQVHDSQGQLNPSLICHWHKPLRTITTVSLKAQGADGAAGLHGRLLTSTFLLVSFSLCMFALAYIRKTQNLWNKH